MRYIHRFAAVLVAAAILAGSAGTAMAQGVGKGRLTQARHLSASRASGTLRGELLSSDTCHKVRFVKSPMTIYPPVFIAQQYRYRTGICAMVVRWLPAWIAIPRRAPYVTVNTVNGARRVPLR